MREAVTLAVFLAAMACGGIWLLQDDPDATAADLHSHGLAGDYRPGPAWLHRRLGQTISMAPLRALAAAPLSNLGGGPTLGGWTSLP